MVGDQHKGKDSGDPKVSEISKDDGNRFQQRLQTHGLDQNAMRSTGLSSPEVSSADRASDEDISVGGLTRAPARKRVKVGPQARRINDQASSPVSVDRPAGPHATNAPLKTPRGSRLITYTQAVVDSSPSKTSIPRPTTSTSHLLDQACAHLIQADPRLESLIAKHHCELFSPNGLAEVIDPFQSLCSSIMAQQVSGAAATSIKNKFIGLFQDDIEGAALRDNPSFPSPAKVAPCTVSFLRQAGLSARKAEYIKGLAEKFENRELTAAMLINASDEEILEKLTAVRGLGLWSVQMFACFALKRTDIFSTGDLGVQRGMAAFMGKNVQNLKASKGGKWKYMSESDMLQHSAKFAPYRSLFMWYMWRMEEVDVAAISS
ncbi:MAG: hypothetical protein L6R36_001203 [Xanthoria steineri]|nr:MAG: hypothetical protein L6R36_001203 [Xanthoria steineri]